jgi:hypothetical protein
MALAGMRPEWNNQSLFHQFAGRPSNLPRRTCFGQAQRRRAPGEWIL